MTEEVKKEQEVKVIDKDFCSPLIGDNDVFDVKVEYYKDGNKMFVNGVDEIFDVTRKNNIAMFSFRYPTQADVSILNRYMKEILNGKNEMTIAVMSELEVRRFLNLIKKWNLGEELNNENIMKLHPKIVKAVLNGIRAAIEMDGIF